MKALIIFVICSIFALLLFVSGYFYVNNNRLQNQVADQIIDVQNAEAEALQFQKKIGFLNTDLLVVQSENEQLKFLKDDLTVEVDQMQREINRLTELAKEQNIDKQQIILGFEKQLKSVQEVSDNSRIAFDNQVSDLNSRNQVLMDENHKLEQAIVEFQHRNINHIRIEAIGNNQTTNVIRAGRTQRLVMTFEMPVREVSGLHFQVLTPSGQQLKSTDNSNLQVNITSKTSDSSQVELIYMSNTFEKGIYGLWVYHNQTLASAAQIRLR